MYFWSVFFLVQLERNVGDHNSLQGDTGGSAPRDAFSKYDQEATRGPSSMCKSQSKKLVLAVAL